MIDKLEILFPHIFDKECLMQTSKKKIDLYDDKQQGRCYIDGKGQTEFQVFNLSEKNIGFLAVDACLLSSSDPSRSDCMVFTDEVVCFIELKICKRKNVKDNQKGATDQLESFIQYFRENDLDKDKKLEAYVCVNCIRTGETISRVPRSAKDMSRQEVFLKKYKTKLLYKCEKEFL
ncbi:MAG: Unknown protein [uncultured Sulfurovum sp.]|uniref:Uncharacterized protein n=1 Tax=uncultured Sulfurovum sp. TaxID=269237 RepID=A0A6S6TUG9_9BACT|nr:MAG: Unknown protein [uncultured Sulfurovum sp.]